MYTKTKVLLGAAVVALACAGTAAALPPTAHYPWVQLPAWVGSGTAGVLSTASQPDVQPPAWIATAPVTRAPAVAGSSYRWVQLPAWIGTNAPRAALPATSVEWAQPPAWIPAY